MIFHHARLHFRQIQDRRNEVHQSATAIGHDAQCRPLVLSQGAWDFIEQEVCSLLDRRHRRAKFMRHMGKKLTLDIVKLLKFGRPSTSRCHPTLEVRAAPGYPMTPESFPDPFP